MGVGSQGGERGFVSLVQGWSDSPPDADAVMFTAVDHPCIQGSTFERLAAGMLEGQAPLIIPTYRGSHGHPVCITRRFITELLALPASAQARDVIHRHLPEACLMAVDDSAVTTDIDDPAA